MRRALVVLFAVGLIGAPPAPGQGIDVRALAAGCASCHRPAQRVPPPLAGQSRETLAAKLRGFRDGTRDGTVMPRIAKGYTPAELDALASYFAVQSSPQ